jgi:hypothetical protein
LRLKDQTRQKTPTLGPNFRAHHPRAPAPASDSHRQLTLIAIGAPWPRVKRGDIQHSLQSSGIEGGFLSISASAAEAVAQASASATSAGIAQSNSVGSAVASAATSAASTVNASLFTNDAWFNGFATLLGALAGGYVASHVAYKLQLRATKKREREQALVEAHQLMFCIIQQLNTILLVWGDHFSPHVDNAGRFMNAPATTLFDLDRHVVDVAKMTILLDCKAGRAVLYDLNIAQEAYREALQILNERSRVHRENLQPALEKSGLNGQDVTNEMMMDEIGERLVLTMIGLTDGCYMMMHRSFAKLTAVKDRARQYVVERFGTDDFTKVDFPETKGIENEPKQHYPKRRFPGRPKAVRFGFGTAFNGCRLWPDA